MVYLTGHLDRHRLEDKLLNDVVHIEIHDRDPLPASLLTASAKDKVGMARPWALIWRHLDARDTEPVDLLARTQAVGSSCVFTSRCAISELTGEAVGAPGGRRVYDGPQGQRLRGG